MPIMRNIERIRPGAVIADWKHDGRRFLIGHEKIKVDHVEIGACSRTKVHINGIYCYDVGAQVWVF